jgi:hypothetical protein
VGVVQRRGFSFGVAGGVVTLERRVPVAFEADTGRGFERTPIPETGANPILTLLPVAAYIAIRALLKRRNRA